MLFTDIEGSTRLLRDLGERYGEVLSDHRTIIRAAVTAHGGHEMGTDGDSFFIVFPSAALAVTAAIEAQRALNTHEWPAQATVRVRIGLETGEPLPHENNYMGLDVHRAARIAGAAHGGQIVIGAQAQQDVIDQLSPYVALRDLGWHRLKDLAEPERLYQVLPEGLVDVATPPKSLGAPSNLPSLPAPLVGRAREIETAQHQLANSHRLVTLTGPGGVGKTSLALEVARLVEGDYSGGVYFVPLEEVRTSGAAWDSLARTLGLPSDEITEQTVITFLANRNALLVLDNLEQIDDAADVARALVERTDCTLLTTSRRPLRLRFEHETMLAPLAAPEPGTPFEQLTTTPAVELFVREAQRVRSSFALTSDNASAVAAVCARLEGLPLAIELAAAQLRVLSPIALARSIGQRVALASREHDRPGRQRTLEAAIAWSVDLLAPDDRDCFEHLGVFAGGADLAAVAAVLPAATLAGRALEVIEALADVSLVAVGEGPSGEPRVTMLGMVREAALSALGDRGDLDHVRRRHCEHFVALAEEAGPYLRGPESLTWTDRLAAEEDNLREAFDWSSATDDPDRRLLAVRLVTALGWFWYTHGRASEGRARIERAIRDGGALEPRRRADAQHALGVLEQQQGENQLAIAAFEASLEVWRSVSDRTGIARELNSIGVALMARGDARGARAKLEESIGIAREVGDDTRIAAATSNLGILDLTVDRSSPAIAAFQEALAIDTRIGDHWAIAADQCNLGAALAAAGEVDGARRALAVALSNVVELGDSDVLVSTLEACVLLACASNDHEQAIVLAAGADALRRSIQVPRTTLDHALLERSLDSARAALDGERHDRAFERGQSLRLEGLLSEATSLTCLDPRAMTE